jgi:hypothetical protein
MACLRKGVPGSLTFLVLLLIQSLCPLNARADVFRVTFINVTFSATCIGQTGACAEVINGSGLYDPATDTAWDISIHMAGSLNASLNAYGSPACNNPTLCLGGGVLYDANALSGFNPIEFSPILPGFSRSMPVNVPTPQPIATGPSGSLLFIPYYCGGDQPACRDSGTFPVGADFQAQSGMYTAVDTSAPEPAAALLFSLGMTGIAILRRRMN